MADGTLLWNLQTQKAEWVPLSEVKGKLATGSYRAYEGSEVVTQHGEALAGNTPEEGARKIGAGVQAGSDAKLRAKARQDAQDAHYDTIGDKLLQTTDGFLRGITGGGLHLPRPEYEREASDRVNGAYGTLGEVASIGATLLFPESLLKYTPMGMANKVQTAVAGRLAAKGASVFRVGAAEALGAASAGTTLATGAQVLRGVTGQGISGDALVDDIGLNLVVGGGLGLFGGAVGRMAGKIKNARTEVEAAAKWRTDDLHGAVGDAVSAWDSAHTGAKARLGAIKDQVDLGLLDSTALPGKEWMAGRQAASDAADKARKAFLKAAGTDNIPDAIARVKAVAEDGKVGDLKVFKALDDYGNAVAALDDAMLPTHVDDAHFGEILGDFENEIDSVPLAAEGTGPIEPQFADTGNAVGPKGGAHPLARIPRSARKSPQGIPLSAEEAARNLDELNEWAMQHPDNQVPELGESAAKADIEGGHATPEQGTAPGKRPLKADGGQKPADLSRVKDSGPLDAASFRPQSEDLAEAANVRVVGKKPAPSGREATARIARPIEDGSLDLTGSIREIPTIAEPGINPRRAPAADNSFIEPTAQPQAAATPKEAQYGPWQDWSRPSDIGAKAPAQSQAARNARAALSEHMGLPRAPRTTMLGTNIQGAMDKLTQATNGRLGMTETRTFAQKLGVNLQKYNGPLASKMVDAWALRRMATAIAEEAGVVSGGGKPGLISRALKAGAVGKAAEVGYGLGGKAGASASANIMSHVLGSVGAIAAVAGRFKNSAVLGMARVLSPVGRKALTLGVAQQALLTSYDRDQPPTRDFAIKTDQIRKLAANTDYVKDMARMGLRDVAGLDPQLVEQAAESSSRRIKNLASRIPNGTYRGPFEPPGPPGIGEMDEFHQYEAVTADRSLIFSYIKSGYVPPVVVDAMNEQHPDFMQELRKYVVEHPEEMQKASHETKMALSSLLMMPLEMEADPAYVQRQQQPYEEAKQDAAMKKQMKQGAAAIKGGLAPTPGQVFAQPMIQR